MWDVLLNYRPNGEVAAKVPSAFAILMLVFPGLSGARRAAIRRTRKAAEIGEPEAGCIFETVSEQAVETDMGEPNQGERQQHVDPRQQSGGREEERCGRRMHGVIGSGADTWACQVPKEAEIGDKKKDCKQPPWRPGFRIEDGCSGEEGRAFGAQ